MRCQCHVRSILRICDWATCSRAAVQAIARCRGRWRATGAYHWLRLAPIVAVSVDVCSSATEEQPPQLGIFRVILVALLACLWKRVHGCWGVCSDRIGCCGI